MPPPGRWWRDLVLVAAVTLLAWAASVRWNLAEFLASEYRPEEGLQLDEAPGVLLVLAVGLLWYAWRRFREARAAAAHSLRAERQLAAAFADNRRLLRQYAEVQEAERAALSRELHDELGQYLNAIKLDAVALRRAGSGGEAAAAIVGNVDYVHGVVGGLIRRLRPVGLDELGLEAALEHCLEGWRARLPQAELSLCCEGELDSLGETANLAVYRIVQEGLTNVSRHSAARHVRIHVARQNEENAAPALLVEVGDDGRGMDLQAPHRGLGLIGMRERVETLGGELHIDTRPGGGCRLRARIPLAA